MNLDTCCNNVNIHVCHTPSSALLYRLNELGLPTLSFRKVTDDKFFIGRRHFDQWKWHVTAFHKIKKKKSSLTAPNYCNLCRFHGNIHVGTLMRVFACLIVYISLPMSHKKDARLA